MNFIEFFSNHTFRMVFLGTAMIGFVSGALGSFAYLRKQSLVSDVISHAALPGSLAAFLITVTVFDGNGRSVIVLLIGALITASAAVALANYIAERTKLGIDTTMAISLAGFFGAGMLLMRIIANGTFKGKGGIQDYLFGNASVMTWADLRTIAIVGGLAVAVMIIFFKEFELRTFDPDQATLHGFAPGTIDSIMFLTIVTATVVGMKAVGLVLMVAFVVTPPAAARQWVDTLPAMVTLSALIGGFASALGAYISIAIGRVPTGPLITIILFTIFVFSLLFSPKRSIIAKAMLRSKARKKLVRDLETARN